MSTCKVCGKTDAETEFYASIKTHCKEHWRARVKANREANIEHYREFDRNRANLPHRVQARAEYQQTPAYEASHRKSMAKYRSERPDRRAAHVALGNAARDGKVTPLPCFCCGAKAEAHHPDYSDPLYPVWLCPAHHKQTHAMVKRSPSHERTNHV